MALLTDTPKAVKLANGTHVLIDFENVQTNLKVLASLKHCKVWLFAGCNQHNTKSFKEFEKLLGSHVNVIKMEGSGKNALDFQLTLHLGRLVEKFPDRHFAIVANDQGYDYALKQLISEGFAVERIEGNPAMLRAPTKKSKHKKVAKVAKVYDAIESKIISYLGQLGTSKPKKFKTLVNAINAVFAGKLAMDAIDALIARLREDGLIAIENNKVSYFLAG